MDAGDPDREGEATPGTPPYHRRGFVQRRWAYLALICVLQHRAANRHLYGLQRLLDGTDEALEAILRRLTPLRRPWPPRRFQ